MQELPHALPLVQTRQHLIGGVHDRATGASRSSSLAAAPNANLRSSDAAGELVQRVLLVVIEKLRGQEVREVGSIASFVLGTAHHVTIAMRRADAKMRPLSEMEEPTTDQPPPALDVRRVVTCMGELEERDRTVVALSFFDEMTAPEIATAVGTSAGNVRVMRHRALGALRECFERQAVAS